MKQEKKSRQKSSGYFFVLFLCEFCGQKWLLFEKEQNIIFIISDITHQRRRQRRAEEIKKRAHEKKW